jgi:hypothetical protein
MIYAGGHKSTLSTNRFALAVAYAGVFVLAVGNSEGQQKKIKMPVQMLFVLVFCPSQPCGKC